MIRILAPLLLALTTPALATDLFLVDAPLSFTSDTSQAFPDARNDAVIQVDKTSGTGTFTFQCRAHPSAPYQTLLATTGLTLIAGALSTNSCTDDCIVKVNASCERIQVVTSGSASLVSKVYLRGRENAR